VRWKKADGFVLEDRGGKNRREHYLSSSKSLDFG